MCTLRAPRVLAAALLVTAAAACGDSGGPTPPALTGEYVLLAVDGESLPYVHFSGVGYTRSITGATLTPLSRGRIREVRRYAISSGETLVDTLVGPYRLVGDTLIIERPATSDADTYADTAVLDGDVLLLHSRFAERNVRPATGGYEFLYRKP